MDLDHHRGCAHLAGFKSYVLRAALSKALHSMARSSRWHFDDF